MGSDDLRGGNDTSTHDEHRHIPADVGCPVGWIRPLAEANSRRLHELNEVVGYVARSTFEHFSHLDEATARRCAATMVTLAGDHPALGPVKRRCLEFVR